MKRIILGSFACLCLAGCGQTSTSSASSALPSQSSSETSQNQKEDIIAKKSLVAVFSVTSHTLGIAEQICDITGSDFYRIEAKVPYTDADINYGDSSSRTSKEQNDPSCRPEIGSHAIDMSSYDLVYLGYPIWWGQAPKIVYTFVESYDFKGKTIVPFVTSGSSPIGSSATNLATSSTEATWKDGKRFAANASKNEIETWIASLGE